MLATNYIFTQNKGQFSSYPSDENSEIFKKICKESKANTQIVIRRDSHLIYYCYVRLYDEQILGLCRIYNGLYLKNIPKVFDAFEEIVAKIVVQGIILKFNTNGEIVYDSGNLYNNPSHIEYTITVIDEFFEKLESYAKELPPEKYFLTTDAIKIFSCNDSPKEIVKASYTYGYTIIYKDSDYETIQVNTYKGVLYSIKQENSSLRKKRFIKRRES